MNRAVATYKLETKRTEKISKKEWYCQNPTCKNFWRQPFDEDENKYFSPQGLIVCKDCEKIIFKPMKA